MGGLSFSPSSLSAVSAWLRVAQATSDVNGISSVPDVLNSNPAVQSVTARKPMPEASAGNGLPCMRFATNDVLVWPITAQSSASNYAGWGGWVKPDSVAAAAQRLIRVATGTNNASATKLVVGLNTSFLTGSAVGATSGTITKTTAPASIVAAAWHFCTIEFDQDGASDNARITLTLNAVPLVTLATDTLVGPGLVVATGNILIGNGNDGAASSPLNGLIGPNIFAFGSKMAGATTGLLTTAARTALMNFEAPT